MDGYLPLTGGTLSGPGNLNVSGITQLGVPLTSPSAGTELVVNANTATRTGSYGVADFIGPASGNASIYLEAVGGAYYNTIAYNGTIAAPTAITGGWFMGGLVYNGYDGSTVGQGSAMYGAASETWSNTAHGSEIFYYTNPTGTTTSAPHAGITNDGSIYAGTGSQLAANATGNFMMIPRIAADPTGTPSVTRVGSNLLSSQAPAVFNAANDKLWMYDGSAWQNMGQPITGRTAFTPTVTFATPGDLSVAYTTQSGFYAKVGPLVFVTYTLVFTPTYTTASGNLVISQPPAAITAGTNWPWPVSLLSAATWPASTTTVVVRGVSTGILVTGLGSTGVNTAFTTTQFVSGTAYNLQFSGFYF